MKIPFPKYKETHQVSSASLDLFLHMGDEAMPPLVGDSNIVSDVSRICNVSHETSCNVSRETKLRHSCWYFWTLAS